MSGRAIVQTQSSAGYADRRRDRRYQVDLPGVMLGDGHQLRVFLSDVSASGALAVIEEEVPSFELGETFMLAIQDFDTLDAKIVHLGRGFYGIAFTKAHLHRQRLKAWLLGDVIKS